MLNPTGLAQVVRALVLLAFPLDLRFEFPWVQTISWGQPTNEVKVLLDQCGIRALHRSKIYPIWVGTWSGPLLWRSSLLSKKKFNMLPSKILFFFVSNFIILCKLQVLYGFNSYHQFQLPICVSFPPTPFFCPYKRIVPTYSFGISFNKFSLVSQIKKENRFYTEFELTIKHIIFSALGEDL